MVAAMTRIFLALGALVLLSGCGAGMNNLLTFGGDKDDETVVAETPAQATAPVVAAIPNDAFCRAVAAQDATSSAFDTPTQQRVATRSYTQCVTTYAPR